MLDASLISSHLQGVTRHSLLHVSSREFVYSLSIAVASTSLSLFEQQLLMENFFFSVCYLFSSKQPWVCFLRVSLAFSPTIHYSFPSATAWFRNYSEAHHVLYGAARLAWKRSKTKTIKWVQRTIEWQPSSPLQKITTKTYVHKWWNSSPKTATFLPTLHPIQSHLHGCDKWINAFWHFCFEILSFQLEHESVLYF